MYIKRYLFHGYIVAYALAVGEPSFLDPQLSSNVAYGARAYPLAGVTVAILIVLAVAEWLILRRARTSSRRLYLSLWPFVIACLLSLPLFQPEIPHPNITTLGIVTLLLGALTIAISDWASALEITKRSESATVENQITYLKEAIAVTKQLLLWLLGGFAGLIFTWYNTISKILEGVVTDDAELHLLQNAVALNLLLFVVFYLSGPVFCAFRASTALLFQIKQLAEGSEATES